MPDFINLLDEIASKTNKSHKEAKRAKFRTSVMTTYAAYLPFYENVVLRRLQSTGCRYNVLLVDAHDLARSLQDPTRMPRLAGRKYILAPILAKGVFHPKIVMLLGDHDARILVGSHNTTLSGFGYNRELTTRIDLEKRLKGEHKAFFQDVWRALKDWTTLQSKHLPPKLMDAILRIGVEKHPWLSEESKQTAETLFLSSLPEGQCLWDKTRTHIPQIVKNIIILGPFFDKEGAFIKRLHEDLKPQSIAIGFDTEADNTSLCKQSGLPSGVSFHDGSTLIKGSAKQHLKKAGYLHAKALFFDAPGDLSVLITGSANPSFPAWLAPPSGRNAEAVVIHRGKNARKVAEAIGLLQIPSLPSIDASELERLYAKPPALPNSSSSSFRHSLVAETIEGGIFIPGGSISQRDITNCRVLFENQPFLNNVPFSKHKDGLLVEVKKNKQSITQLILTLTDESIINLFVHNPVTISKLAITSRQQTFQDALNSLDSDSPDFSALFEITSKLIFDDRNTKETKTKVKTASEIDQSKEKEEESLGPLSVSIEETKHPQRRRRELHHSDLAFIIDALIYNLGIGLNHAAERIEENRLSEEEQVGQEEDDTPDYAPEISKESLLKTCHSKIGTLINRMCKKLKSVKPDTPEGLKAIDQLLAILAVIREIRANDLKLNHIIANDTLVPLKMRRKLLEASIKALFGDQKDLFDKTAKLFKDDPENDMPRLLGLIIWLTWDCRLNAQGIEFIPRDKHETRRTTLLGLAKLFSIAIRAGHLTGAFKEAKHSIWRLCRENEKGIMSNWVQQFEKWAKDLTKIEQLTNGEQQTVKPEVSHLGIAIKEKTPRLRVILEVSGNTVKFAELGRKDNEATFSSAVKAVAMPQLSASLCAVFYRT